VFGEKLKVKEEHIYQVGEKLGARPVLLVKEAGICKGKEGERVGMGGGGGGGGGWGWQLYAVRKGAGGGEGGTKPREHFQTKHRSRPKIEERVKRLL